MRTSRQLLATAAVTALVLTWSTIAPAHNGSHGAGGAKPGGGQPGHAAARVATAEPVPARGNAFKVTNLVSDGAIAARHTDKNLVNAWGIAFASNSKVRVADNGTDLSTAFGGTGNPEGITVSIPDGAPTGIVANNSDQFRIHKGNRAGASRFIFASEAGVISAWNPQVDRTHALAEFKATNGAIFKGLASAAIGNAHLLFATDFHNGQIEVFNHAFQPVHPSGDFRDATLPTGFAPFGIQNVNGRLLVTFAKQDAAAHDDVHGMGLGFVDAFDPEGHLLRRVVSRGVLDAPWGLAMAPASFGGFRGDLLVGNFGNGTINAFDRPTGHLEGQLRQSNGEPVVIDGLWGIGFDPFGARSLADTLFFAAGPADESEGLVGRIDVKHQASQ
jgi:uncharacterized protein (TIGR03118 family)